VGGDVILGVLDVWVVVFAVVVIVVEACGDDPFSGGGGCTTTVDILGFPLVELVVAVVFEKWIWVLRGSWPERSESGRTWYIAPEAVLITGAWLEEISAGEMEIVEVMEEGIHVTIFNRDFSSLLAKSPGIWMDPKLICCNCNCCGIPSWDFGTLVDDSLLLDSEDFLLLGYVAWDWLCCLWITGGETGTWEFWTTFLLFFVAVGGSESESELTSVGFGVSRNTCGCTAFSWSSLAMNTLLY